MQDLPKKKKPYTYFTKPKLISQVILGVRVVEKTNEISSRAKKKVYGHTKPKVCECCGQSSEKSLVVDQAANDTLRFRGWLCEQCNHLHR